MTMAKMTGLAAKWRMYEMRERCACDERSVQTNTSHQETTTPHQQTKHTTDTPHHHHTIHISINKHAIPSRELFIETRRIQLSTAEHPCSSSLQSPGTCISSEVSEPSPCTPCTPDAAPASWSASPTPLPPRSSHHLLVENRLGLTSETLLLGIVSSLTYANHSFLPSHP